MTEVKRAGQTVVRWGQDPAPLQGKAVYMSQTGADASKFLIGIYGTDGSGAMFNRYANGKSTLPAKINNVDFLLYANEVGSFEFDVKPQLELGTAATEWARPDVTTWGGVAPSANLLPGFSDLTGFSQLGRGWEALADGWGRLSLDNSAGASTAYANFFSKPLAEVLASSTMLLEVRALSGCSIAAASRSTATGSEVNQAQLATPSDWWSVRADGEFRLPLAPTGSASPVCSLRSFASVAKGATGSAEVRISLYEGGYDGPYVPYAGK